MDCVYLALSKEKDLKLSPSEGFRRNKTYLFNQQKHKKIKTNQIMFFQAI